jgi:benzoyl-CoA reductase/2-hydroxyglutaryl-CoA dehydratase subunit BcrC/BadD/HgdB
MKTLKQNKSFDAVKMMRDSRDLISKETQNMSLSELNNYIKQKLAKSKRPKIGDKNKN